MVRVRFWGGLFLINRCLLLFVMGCGWICLPVAPRTRIFCLDIGMIMKECSLYFESQNE